MEAVGVKCHAQCVAACELIPIPVVDTLAQNWIRRHLVSVADPPRDATAPGSSTRSGSWAVGSP